MNESRAVSAFVVNGIGVNGIEHVRVEQDGTVRWTVTAARGGTGRTLVSADPAVAAFVKELLAARLALTAGGDRDRATSAASR